MQMPMADFFYSVPYDALMADGMKGGYVGRETVEQVECAHVSFADDLVEWHLWLPQSGDPLPKKYRVIAKRMRGHADLRGAVPPVGPATTPRPTPRSRRTCRRASSGSRWPRGR